jgi:hypothetical protein
MKNVCFVKQTFLVQLKQKLRAPRHSYPEQSRDSYEGVNEQEFEQTPDNFDEDYLTRDDFNLHKMIVAVTAPGKVFVSLLLVSLQCVMLSTFDHF